MHMLSIGRKVQQQREHKICKSRSFLIVSWAVYVFALAQSGSSVSHFDVNRVDEISGRIQTCRLISEADDDEDEDLGPALTRRPTLKAESETKSDKARPVLSLPIDLKRGANPCWMSTITKEQQEKRDEADRQAKSSFWVKHNLSALVAGARTF